MLANSNETPRPRPPALARRQTKASPPPPYALSLNALAGARKPGLETLLGSPISATAHKVGFGSPQHSREQSLEDNSWMNEKSREELSELLVKADGLIKERETELDMTSVVYKNLYQNNATLKSKHQALVARITPSPLTSPVPSAFAHDSPHYYSSNLPRSMTDSFNSSLSRSAFLAARPRKISVSPTDIALLSDQNAELVEKLQKLETESAMAEQSGRRMLKKLEGEIQVLREELEKTQAKSEELEEQAKTGFGLDPDQAAVEVLRRKQERESKFRAIRGNAESNDDDDDTAIKDFAPGGLLSSGPQVEFSLPSAKKRHELEMQLGQSAPMLLPFITESPLSDMTTPISPDGSFSQPPPENALISQLLLKIRELEQTNAHIIAQQKATSDQLQAVQRETENISKVYEHLGEPGGIELELVADDCADHVGSKSRVSSNGTVRLRSLRRSLGHFSEMTPAEPEDADVFGNSMSAQMHSTMRSDVVVGPAPKARKSVVGLFDAPDEDPARQSFPFPSPATGEATSSWSMDDLSPTYSSPAHTPHMPMQLLSPMLDGLRHSLESELGSDFGDWDADAGSHHLRTSSLYELSRQPSMSVLRPATPPAQSPVEAGHGLRTPVSMADRGLQISLMPPTPNPEAQGKSRDGEARGQQRARSWRLSQTLRKRTVSWVGRRFPSAALGSADKGKGRSLDMPVDDLDRVATSSSIVTLPQKLASSLETMLESFSGQSSEQEQAVAEPQEAKPEPRQTQETGASGEQTQAVQLHHDDSRVVRQQGAGAMLLELWLWLQFAIIIMVFLWAMARRGPKQFLKDANRRRSWAGR